MRKIAVTLAFALAVCAGAIAQDLAGLAPTPPMGWNSWNRFGCDVDETLVRATADAMVASGMRDAGYVYVNIDDCWQGTRDDDGLIGPDPERFPAGMKALADYVHARGLKLGLYSDAGNTTCGGRPGSRGHEYQDALTYARWGIDYLKYDWCATDGLNARGAYTTMRDALAAAGRPIVLSICEWGDNQPWTWGKDVGHLWRTTGDIHPCWECEIDHGGWSSLGVLRILDKQKGLRAHAGPGHWNDPDMLEVGNGMTQSEDRAHFSLWAMLAAPLLAGNDLREMSDDTRRILTNREVIAIDQDSLGIQGYRWRAEGDIEIWARPLAAGAWALCVLNRGESARRVELRWRDEPIADDHSTRRTDFATMEYLVLDVWQGRDLGSTRAALVAEVAAHDVLMVRLTPTGPEAAK